jgi:hypothetical protein
MILAGRLAHIPAPADVVVRQQDQAILCTNGYSIRRIVTREATLMESETRAECTACGASLQVDSTGPCPICGKTGTKKVYKNMAGSIRPTATLDISKIHNSVAFNAAAIIGLIVITLVSPLIGLLLPGLGGVALGYGLSLIGIVVGYFAITKVKEIERYINR